MKTLQGAKYLWQIAQCDTDLALSLASSYNISPALMQTLVARGLTTSEQIDSYLFTSFEKDVASAGLMKDAQKAVDRINQAIERQEKILVFGDYDVDGITSSAMMMICLLPLGAKVNFFLPHRVRDGYGLSTKIVERAKNNGYSLIITVDNGITAFEPARLAKEYGIDLIITDHHRAHGKLPDAYAVVNPNQDDCQYPFKVLAGVGVGFKLLSLLYEQRGLSMPAKAYELLLLGTIADVVPLTGENRYWVRHGLSYVNANESMAFKVLKSNGKIQKNSISSTDIGFSIAPQINALGRLEDPRQGVSFLVGSDGHEVEQVGKVLFELNQARKDIERLILDEVQGQIDSGVINCEQDKVILAGSTKWPPGVIGLVASRLVGMYGRPTLLYHITKDGLAKGSCRSIPEFNMFDALAESQDLFVSFGGHSQAAGFALPLDKVPVLKERLQERIKQVLKPEDLLLKLRLDAPVSLTELTKKFVDDLTHLEPFGHENRQPSFYIQGVTLVQKPLLMKGAHIKCQLFAEGVIKPIVFFNRPELFEPLMAQEDTPFDVAATVVENHWNGKVSIELQGIDVANVGQKGT